MYFGCVCAQKHLLSWSKPARLVPTQPCTDIYNSKNVFWVWMEFQLVFFAAIATHPCCEGRNWLVLFFLAVCIEFGFAHSFLKNVFYVQAFLQVVCFIGTQPQQKHNTSPIVDVACGHGLLAVLLAYRYPHRPVVACDTKQRDVFDALLQGFLKYGTTSSKVKGTVTPLSNLTFAEGLFQDVINPELMEGTQGTFLRLCLFLLCCGDIMKNVFWYVANIFEIFHFAIAILIFHWFQWWFIDIMKNIFCYVANIFWIMSFDISFSNVVITWCEILSSNIFSKRLFCLRFSNVLLTLRKMFFGMSQTFFEKIYLIFVCARLGWH